MLLDPDQCYRALRTHDVRFDGRFFVGVATTGVYCRPVCGARTPNRGNCHFFPSAAAAEARGFRPCLRCRPELAPGYAAIDATRRLAQSAASLIEDAGSGEANLARIADRLGVTDRHLRRVFQQEYGVAPVAYAQTQRLLLAKRLLTDTRLGVLDVAMASGFSSLRRFNALFRARYRMTPGALRRTSSPGDGERPLAFDLGFRPPYDWEAMLAFLARRAVPRVEQVGERRYARIVRIARDGRDHAGVVSAAMSPRRNALRVSIAPSLAPVLPAVLARVKHLFDLACRPDEIAAALGAIAASRPGLRLPGAVDGFEIAVRAILGQQVTVRAATTLASRLVERFGEPVETGIAGLDRAFPRAEVVATLESAGIARLGVVPARARAIVALAQAVSHGALRLDPEAPVEPTIAALRELPGVGPWTAEYIAMRALGWPDAFPHPDVAVLNALGTRSAAQAQRRFEAWRPWRAYAVLHLWKSLEARP